MESERTLDKLSMESGSANVIQSVNASGQQPDVTVQNTMNKPCACGKEGCSCASERGKMFSTSYVYALQANKQPSVDVFDSVNQF
jgi:hypothetical protein